jgi:uncharacterized membrane protein YeaQ/YmgE (transglycosylase-associated protein family)
VAATEYCGPPRPLSHHLGPCEELTDLLTDLTPSEDTLKARSPHIRKVPVLIVGFIFLGLIAGYVAVGLFKSTGKGVVWDFGLGVIGAVLVGSLFSQIAATGAAGLNTATALVAALTGAAALLATFHGLRDTPYRPGDQI